MLHWWIVTVLGSKRRLLRRFVFSNSSYTLVPLWSLSSPFLLLMFAFVLLCPSFHFSSSTLFCFHRYVFFFFLFWPCFYWSSLTTSNVGAGDHPQEWGLFSRYSFCLERRCFFCGTSFLYSFFRGFFQGCCCSPQKEEVGQG